MGRSRAGDADRAADGRVAELEAANADLSARLIWRNSGNLFVVLLTSASVGLIPWIVLLAITLPHRYVAAHLDGDLGRLRHRSPRAALP